MRQRQALRVMLNGNSVFLTGPPGAGKTHVLNEFIRKIKKNGSKVAITASTGIAATHIGGTTIHSWSGLGIREVLSQWDKDRLLTNNALLSRYNSTDILVIDEVSMLHGRRLDLVNEACQLLRKSDEPFGGMQVILVGDLFQLPPVNRGSERLDFVHTSKAWEMLNPRICYLSEQHRQTGDGLLDVLEAMRQGAVEEEHAQLLQERLDREIDASLAITRLYAHNVDVETINQDHLTVLDGETKRFTMQKSGAAAKVEQLVKSVLAPEILELKIGAEVMFVANNFAAGFVNGTRGKVVNFVHSMPIVQLMNGKEIKVEPHAWTLQEDGKKRAEVVQLPLRLAWAITIHKSQGMSLDAAEIDLSRTFTPGMGYVALSRVRNLKGLYLKGINRMALTMHQEIYDFDKMLREASHALAATTEDEELEEVSNNITEGEEITDAALDNALLAKLKTWRLQRAQAEGLPPYLIAHNKVLEAIAAQPPQTMQGLLGVKGFGAKKFEQYGSEVARIIGEHIGTEISNSYKPPQGNYHWRSEEDALLIDLFRRGMTLEIVSQQLKRSPTELWNRLQVLLSQSQ